MEKVRSRLLYYNNLNIKKNTNRAREKIIKGCAKVFHYYPVPYKYAGRQVIRRRKTNEIIGNMIEGNKPFAVGRFGSTELNTLAFYQMMRTFKNPEKIQVWNTINSRVGTLNIEYRVAIDAIEKWCGFYPTDEINISKLNSLMMHSIPQIDLLGTWDVNMEEFFIEQYMPNTIISNLYYLEPWLASNPWSSKLKGKNVLVIHPFQETIISQYKKRTHIFNDPDVLPEFNLMTLKAVQTIAGNRDERFSDWFEALDYMFQNAMERAFDVAIIGCGAYGMPLAVKLKNAGRKAIHLGGATQLMFGIKGSRWEAKNYPTKIATLFNEFWVRPNDSEAVKNNNIVENGCYW